MTRLLLRAGLVAAITAIALTQLQTTHHLLAWELVLLAVAIWEMRLLPAGRVRADRPLFGSTWSEPVRLPRAVSSTEWMVMDALAGRVGPDRRLRPALVRIASHRLHQMGVELDSPRAGALLGEEEWEWLTASSAEAAQPEIVDRVVSRLEEL
ncbi:MAG TPA: hypothetical protein VIC07_12180 [Acidimicrobiia bacterium]|jgi:hypothetical protein